MEDILNFLENNDIVLTIQYWRNPKPDSIAVDEGWAWDIEGYDPEYDECDYIHTSRRQALLHGYEQALKMLANK